MKTFRFTLFTIATLLCSIMASAHDFEVDGIYYDITSSEDLTVEVTYRGDFPYLYDNEYKGEVVIPESVTYNGSSYSVTSIGYRAFFDCSDLTSITIPNSVTSIGDDAFFGCSGLTSVTIPNSVTSIGGSAFSGCSGLTSVTIPNSVTSIGNYAFYGCGNLSTVINYSTLNITKGSSSNGYVAYYAKVVIDGGTDEKVEDFFFRTDDSGNHYLAAYIGKAETLTLPENYKGENYGIGAYVFYKHDELANVTIPNSVTSIGSSAFSGCFGLTSVTIPNSVTSIGDYAFYGCSGLTSVTIPNSVTSIGSSAFYGCSGLETLVIGAGVTTIGINQVAPTKVIWLTNTPPSGYKNLSGSINYVANEQYTGLSNTKVYSYLSSMFEVNGITYVPVNMTERTCDAIDARYDASVEKTTINSTVSYKGVTMTVKEVMPYIGNNNDCIKSLTISNLGGVGESAFQGCTNLQTATISNQGNIGNSSFYGCTNLQTATISNQGNIGESAFQGCTNLQTVNVSLKTNTDTSNSAPITLNDWTSTNHGSSSTSSETYTFVAGDGDYLTFDWSVSSESSYDWLVVTLDGTTILEKSGSNSGTYSNALNEGEHSLVLKYTKDSSGDSGSDQASVTNINIAMGSETVGRIGNNAFYDCINLQEVTLSEGVTSIGNFAFYGCSSLSEIKIPNSVISLKESTFSGCSALTSVSLGNSVKTIEQKAFYGCTSLPEITIPQSVTNIGNYAFDYCTALADVTISDRTEVLTLGSNGSSPLFADCPLDSVYIGGKITYKTSSNYGYSPFYRNTSLRSVVIGDKEEAVYDNEFYGCTNLKNVNIGNGVKSVGNWAFSGCSSLDQFSFGGNVESIGQEAFSDCTSMTLLSSSAVTPPTCGSQALEDINKWNCVLKVPESYKEAYQAADQWKDFFFIEDVLEVLKFQLTFIVDGEVYQSEEVALNTEIVLPEVPTKEGHTFSGWSEIPETMPAQDVTVEGTFTVNSYTLLYIVDGEEYKKVEVAYGDAIEAEAEPTKEGYIFSGWSEIPETMPANDVTVTGSFEVNGIEDITVNKLVDVYTLQGVKVKEQIPMNSLNEELPRGIYIVNGKKMIVK